MQVPEHVQRHSLLGMIARSNTIHRLLHLPKTTIATLHRIRCRRQILIVQKHKTPIHRRRFQLFQHRRQSLEPLQTFPQLSQLTPSTLFERKDADFQTTPQSLFGYVRFFGSSLLPPASSDGHASTVSPSSFPIHGELEPPLSTPTC